MKASRKHSILPFKQFAIIGAPQCKSSGPSNSAVAFFPQCIRDCGLMEVMKSWDCDVEDFGDAFEPDGLYEPSESDTSDDVKSDGETFLYIKNWESLTKTSQGLYYKVIQAIDDKRIPIVIGGDHGIATGSIAGSLERYPNLILLFIDTHTDINTPFTSVHGNYHGMPIAHLSGLLKAKGFEWMEKVPKLSHSSIIYIGLRALYQVDKDLIDKLGIIYYTMDDICRLGIGKVLDEALNRVDPENSRPIHLSFDIDACDPSVAPGTGSQMEGGLSSTESIYITSFVNNSKRLVSMDFSEININYDITSMVPPLARLAVKPETSITTRFCIRLICEACKGEGIQTPHRFRY